MIRFIKCSFYLILFLPCFINFAHAGVISGSAEIGLNSYTERYSIVEEDTEDNVIDFSSMMTLSYYRGKTLGDFIRIAGQALAGSNNLELKSKANFVLVSGSLRFGGNASITNKNFWENSTYSYANDYKMYNARAFFQIPRSSNSTFRLSNRMEIIDFKERTEFDYDYLRNLFFIEWDYLGTSTYLHSGLGNATKSIPDSTEISYKAYSLDIGCRVTQGVKKYWSFDATLERRIFAHKPIKSSYWALLTRFSARPILLGSFGAEIENVQESYFYDNYSEVYFDYTENKSAFLIMYYHKLSFEIGAGPTFGFLSSKFSSEDRYKEFGGKVSLDYLLGTKFWISSSSEAGKRFYDYYDTNPNVSIFSDYAFFRINLLASWRIHNKVSLNGFISHEPRKHERAGDDASTTLFSLGLSYNF